MFLFKKRNYRRPISQSIHFLTVRSNVAISMFILNHCYHAIKMLLLTIPQTNS